MASVQDNILVVDDDADRRAGIAEQLKEQGYLVAIAAGGRQALEMMSLQLFDMVLLDATMSPMSGLQVLERMKADSSLRHIPVIMMAGFDQATELDRAIELGANDYLFLPYSEVMLRARIESQLKRLPDYEQDYLKNVLKNAKYERDLQIGRQIQGDFLPDTLPEPEGWEIEAYFHPARDVAGDFYDSFMLAQNRRVGIVVADVCDKGVGAALFMALIRSLIRAFAQQNLSLRWMDPLADDSSGESDPFSSVRRRSLPSTGTSALKNAVVVTNNYIATVHSQSNMFATAFFGVLDQSSGSFAYVNGGHNPPVFFGPEGIKARLKPTGPAVGIMPDIDYEIGQIRFEPGDTLLVFTDGVTDARTPQGELFTEKRLLALLEEPVTSARGLLDRIVASLQEHISTADQFDDITMMAVRRIPDRQEGSS
jgi:serine phosphatase RsbU (regulator of sigma subunit)